MFLMISIDDLFKDIMAIDRHSIKDKRLDEDKFKDTKKFYSFFEDTVYKNNQFKNTTIDSLVEKKLTSEDSLNEFENTYLRKASNLYKLSVREQEIKEEYEGFITHSATKHRRALERVVQGMNDENITRHVDAYKLVNMAKAEDAELIIEVWDENYVDKNEVIYFAHRTYAKTEDLEQTKKAISKKFQHKISTTRLKEYLKSGVDYDIEKKLKNNISKNRNTHSILPFHSGKIFLKKFKRVAASSTLALATGSLALTCSAGMNSFDNVNNENYISQSTNVIQNYKNKV